MAHEIKVAELKAALAERLPLQVVDVRLEQEGGAIPGAVHVPLTEVDTYAWPWPRDTIVVVYCQWGREASRYAAEVLEEAGYTDVRLLTGGFQAWELG
ncbi:Rhodanese-like domain-containing protein [Candidatus Hydrogenisulfobacillus filiaventi]|uniref:Rhodanese-like domain-containing protein n=1 Tax=Candidatus Hydrogenisulfobacillus filiaventi TaxID=2707344 RepID=A0A6F8ZDX8_9FIRM|nr:rhodanese-like domain-containing protein [Bacillota bacterium]CAB1128131.1 Rhodanese-like domain-containing protein [Candidatus Hydrogenisulfobacillus filiaventi]